MDAVLLFISVILVSFNPVWIQLALWGGTSPLALTFWQAAFAAAIYTVYALLQRTLFTLDRDNILRLMLVGVSFFLMVFGFSLSLERLSASYTIMLFFSYPLFVLAGNMLIFREKLSRPAIYSLISLLIGVLIITWPQGRPESIAGMVLALGAAVAHAVFIISTGRYTQKLPPLQVAMFAQYGFFTAALVLLPYMSGAALLNPAGLRYGFILAFISSFVGFVLFIKGVAGLGASKAALFSVANLPLSLLFSWLFLNDAPGKRLLAGLLFIGTGIFLESRTTTKE